MSGSPTPVDELTRLKEERDQADRRYNDALTAVDHAVQRVPEMPHPPPPFDDSQVTPLNELWSIVPAAPEPVGPAWRARVAGFVWRVVSPVFHRQQQFNAGLVEHVNKNAATHREAGKALESTITLLRDELAALVTFQSRLASCLQQITPFIDTKVRVIDESIAELRTMATVAQRSSTMTRRELERLMSAGVAVTTGDPALAAASRGAAAVGTSAVNAFKYVGFEDCFRGSPDEVRARLSHYLPCFATGSVVLEIGCGRGEFLDLLEEHGVTARGIDVNHEMVELCRARGLQVEEADALDYLRTLSDESLGGLFAAQVIEHLEPEYLLELLETAHRKLQPGSTIVLETINPACWVAFFESYIRDITHVRPLHPDTLKYLLIASGFGKVDLRFLEPVPDAVKLQPIAPSPDSGLPERWVEAFNTNVERLNRRLFTYLDYAVIGRRI